MSISFNKNGPFQFDLAPFRNDVGQLRVLLVIKKTRFELYQENPNFSQKEVDDSDFKDMKIGYLSHLDSVNKICAILKKNNVEYAKCLRENLEKIAVQNYIVITVGGDGTLLDAAHRFADSLIWGVNSDPIRSVGSLCISTKDNFEFLLSQLLNHQLPLKKLIRIAGYLNGQKLPIDALNEVLIAHENPAAMSRYVISVAGKSEFQKSSGIWVAAPAGSSGAIVSAGGLVQPIDDQRLQVVVREPYFLEESIPSLLFGFAGKQQKLTITSQMQDGCIYFDGPMKKFNFGLGSQLDLMISKQRINLFVTSEMEDRRQRIGKAREKYHRQREPERCENTFEI